MTAKLYTVFGLLLTNLVLAHPGLVRDTLQPNRCAGATARPDQVVPGQVVPLLIKQTPKMGPYGVDSVLVSRYDLAKLEFARQTLLALDFTDTDELISVLKEQAALSQQGREQLMQLTQTRLRTLQDTVSSQAIRIRRLGTLLQRASGRVNNAGALLEQTATSVQTARRRMWWERIGTGLLGVALGVAFRSAL